MKDRGNDLADCFTARVGIAYGLPGCRAQVTNYFGASVGISLKENKVGFFGRNSVRVKGYWVGMPCYQVAGAFLLVLTPVLLFKKDFYWGPGEQLLMSLEMLGTTDIAHYEDQALPDRGRMLGIDVGEMTIGEDIWPFGSVPDDYDFKTPERMEPPTPFLREKFFIEFGVTLIGASFDIGFNPVEFLDFLLGWTTLDITGDDSLSEAEQARLHEEEVRQLAEEHRILYEKIVGGDREPPRMKLEEAQKLLEEMDKDK
jgi:hypothetical protein